MKILISKLFCFVGVSILFACFQNTVYACQHIIPTMCQSYTGAKSIFIGKLVKFDENEPIISAQFETIETLKGKTDKLQTIEFSNGSCYEIDLVIGEKYLVFDDPRNIGAGFIHSINLLSKSDYAIKYIKNLSQTNPTFTISGFLKNLSNEELSKTDLKIVNEKIKQKIAIEKDGRFEFITDKKGDYQVNFNLPFDAQIYTNELGLIEEFTGTNFNYTLSFMPNACSYQEIEIHKKDSK